MRFFFLLNTHIFKVAVDLTHIYLIHVQRFIKDTPWSDFEVSVKDLEILRETF